MKQKVIKNYGIVTDIGMGLKKYKCRWIKQGHYNGTIHVLAEDLNSAIDKAIKIRGCKPSIIQRV